MWILVNAGSGEVGFALIYTSAGQTFFTLGYGDVMPAAPLGRFLAVVESGLGFGFLAAILSYLPALFQAYSRREVNISLLDARGISASRITIAPSRRPHRQLRRAGTFPWRVGSRWAAELLESQLVSSPARSIARSTTTNPGLRR